MISKQTASDQKSSHSCRDCRADYSCQTLGSAMVIIARDLHRWPQGLQKEAAKLMQNLQDLGWKTGHSCTLQTTEDVVQQLTESARTLLEEVRHLRREKSAG
jgi:hypothetical protein